TRELYGAGITHIRNPHYPDAVVALNLKPEMRSHQADVHLRRGVTVKGRLVGPDGQPVKKALMLCESYIPEDYHLNPAYPLEVRDGKFELRGCDLDNAVPVYFLDAKNQLGAVIKLSGKDAAAKDFIVRLQPTGQAKAHFVDDKGKPLTDLRFHLNLVIK